MVVDLDVFAVSDLARHAAVVVVVVVVGLENVVDSLRCTDWEEAGKVRVVVAAAVVDAALQQRPDTAEVLSGAAAVVVVGAADRIFVVEN